MKIITIDFETYFDDEYTLKKLTTEAYIRDERFEAHGAAVQLAGAETVWMRPVQIKEYCEVLRRYQRTGNKIVMLAHHAHFDGLILSHHFDFCPDIWLDTLSMARVCFDSGVRNSLGDLAARLGLMTKTVPYNEFKGQHWHELPPDVQQRVANGAMQDCVLTWNAFQIMTRGNSAAVPYAFPPSELPIVSATVKMFTEPVLVGDIDLLGKAWYAEHDARNNLFALIGDRLGIAVTPELLRKDDQFAAMLRYLEVEPGTKLTPKEAAKGPDIGKEKYAFAKSDPFMQELLNSDDEDVALLVEARLKAQSSIYMSRIERFGDMAMRGPMCVYLAYAAAHTRRWGGGDKANWQNLPRPDPYRPEKGALRRAIKVP